MSLFQPKMFITNQWWIQPKYIKGIGDCVENVAHPYWIKYRKGNGRLNETKGGTMNCRSTETSSFTYNPVEELMKEPTKCDHDFNTVMGGKGIKTERHCAKCGVWEEVEPTKYKPRKTSRHEEDCTCYLCGLDERLTRLERIEEAEKEPEEDKVHKIGSHGAVFFVTSKGDICCECGKLVKEEK